MKPPLGMRHSLSLDERVQNLEMEIARLENKNKTLGLNLTALQANLFIHVHPPLFKNGQRVWVINKEGRIKGRVTSEAVLSIGDGPKWEYNVTYAHIRVDCIEETRLYPDTEFEPTEPGKE